MDRSTTIKDRPFRQETPSSVGTAGGAPTAENEGLYLGNTRCLGATQRDRLITELGAFHQIVRVVGGIPSKHVMARAINSLAPALAPLHNTAHLLACSQTFDSRGQLQQSVPGEGLTLQRSISALQNDSRVYATAPWRQGNFDGDRLLLRSNGGAGNVTFMHPDIQHGILLEGSDANPWVNEALGVVDLAEQVLKKNPQLIYRALFIGGGEATSLELTRTVDLARKFPEQVQIVLAWDTGGVAQQAAARRLTPNTHRIVLDRDILQHTMSSPLRGGPEESVQRDLLTLTRDRLYHESHGAVAQSLAQSLAQSFTQSLAQSESGIYIPAHILRRASHMTSEAARIAGQRSTGEPDMHAHRARKGDSLLEKLEGNYRKLARAALDTTAGSDRQLALSVITAEIIRAHKHHTHSSSEALPSQILSQASPLSTAPTGTVLNINGMRYALVQDQTGSRILVHARTDSADSRAISILNPNALVGERIQSSKPLTEEHLIQGALSTVPLTSLRWSAITPGSRIVYAGIDDRQPIAIEEILAMEPSQRGSHARIVTCLRTPLDGSPAKLLQEERIESSLIIPPTDLPAACSVFVYRNNIAESGPFSEVLQRERPESLRTEQLSSALRDLLQRYSLDRQDRADSKQLHSMAQETRAKRFFSPDAYVTYLTEAAAVNTDYQEMQRTLEKWYRDLDSLSSPPVTSFLHVATLAIRRTLYSDSSEKMRIEHILASTVQIIKTAPQVVQDLQSTQEVLRLFERTSLEFSRLSELPETIQTFSFAEVTPDILARCAQIAQSRVVASRELPTASTSADSFSKGGFLYSEYTPDYLSDALRRGALLTVMHNHRIDPATPVAFTLLHDSKSLPAHLKALLPGNREDGHSYFEVIASDKDLSNPLLNSQLFKSTLARSVLSGSIGIKAITHVENRTIQNMLVKAGFEVAPSSRVSLANPLSATDGKYMVWTKRFSEQRRAVAASAPITRAITHEGYLTSRPDEFKQMSSLAASLGEKPITWFSFGVDSLTGEKLDAVKRCIAISGLSELEGVATYIPTKTVVRLPHSETEPDQHSPQWRIEEENGAGLIESLVHGRTVHQTTVGLALLDPNDPMANTGARTLMPDGTEADLLMMRGNSQKRTAYNYQACNHALRFRVSFPEVADKKSIWDLGNHRAIEFLSLFDNRMCVFAGGGTTILRGITLAIESALEQRKGKTTIVLLKGAGGMTDHAAEHLEQLFPQISTGDAFEFLEVKVVNIESSPEELRAVLERSGRLPSSSDEPR